MTPLTQKSLHDGDDAIHANRQILSKGQLSVNAINFGIPTTAGAQHHVHTRHGKDSWRYRVMEFLHSSKIQFTLMGLLFLDVVILFVEIFLLATYPSCHVIERDGISCCGPDMTTEERRFLTDTGITHTSSHETCPEGLVPTQQSAGCDPHKWQGVHTAETVLFAMTITILCVFAIELNISMLALTPSIFFRQFFFLLDYVIVMVSLVLELVFHGLAEDTVQSIVGLLAIMRIWRFVRIGHGIIEITNDMAHESYERLVAYTEQLEDILKQHDIAIPASDHVVHKMKKESDGILGEIERAHREHLREEQEQKDFVHSADEKEEVCTESQEQDSTHVHCN